MGRQPIVRLVTLSLASLVLIGGCTGGGTAVQQTPEAPSITLPPPADKPSDPWVFRSVLDKKARIITVGLHHDLFVAYDATDCSLYKYWKGDVDFRGAVYTKEHGPQPTSRGVAYGVGKREGPWKTVDGDPLGTRFLGYRFIDGHVEISCKLTDEEGRTAIVSETIEAAPADGDIEFVRQFQLQSDSLASVRLLFAASSVSPDNGVQYDGDWLSSAIERTRSDGKPVADVTGSIQITAAKNTHLLSNLVGLTDAYVAAVSDATGMETDPPESPEPTTTDIEATQIFSTNVAPEIDGRLDNLWVEFEPYKLVNEVAGRVTNAADLSAEFRVTYDPYNIFFFATVVDDISIEDSEMPFRDDAVEIYIDGGNEKAAAYDGNDQQLIFSRSGKGFWASNLAVNHPGTEYAAIETVNGYTLEARIPWSTLGVDLFSSPEIGLDLYVDDDDDGDGVDAVISWHSSEPVNWTDPRVFATVKLVGDKETGGQPIPGIREPGLAARAYDIGKPITRLWPLVPGQTPNKSWVVPSVELEHTNDYAGQEENFVLDITGFLTVELPGEYTFRLTSDDGAILWLDGAIVVDHDGLHGPTARVQELHLEPGDHPIRIYYFQAGAGKTLRLEWQKPGDSDFVLVPQDALSTQAAEVRVTAPGYKRLMTPDMVGRPGDGQPLVDVHPAFDLATVRPEGFEPRVGGMDWLQDGRLVLCLWEPDGGVYLLDGVQGATGRNRKFTQPTRTHDGRPICGSNDALGGDARWTETGVCRKGGRRVPGCRFQIYAGT